jgi:hypothetical protein
MRRAFTRVGGFCDASAQHRVLSQFAPHFCARLAAVSFTLFVPEAP